MSGERELLVEAYLDGSLTAGGAAELTHLLAVGGEPAARIREQVAFAGLLAQMLDPTDAEAMARGVVERLAAEDRPSAFVTAVGRSLESRRLRRPRRAVRTPYTWLPVGMAIAALLMVLIGGWWLWSRPLIRAEDRCQVAEATTADRLQRAGSALAVQPGIDVLVDDEVVSAQGMTLGYGDGTQLRLAAGTRARITTSTAGKRFRLLAGSLEATVAPQLAGRPFILATAEAEIEVVGTHFTLQADDGRTQVDLQQGAVRVVRQGDRHGERQTLDLHTGERVAVAAGEPLVAYRTVALFPDAGLDGWEAQHGQWRNHDGIITGTDAAGGKARLISRRRFTDLDVHCRLRLGQTTHVEMQVGDYNWFFTILPGAGDWIDVHLQQRGARLTCTANGVAVTAEPGAGEPPRAGALAIYVPAGGAIELTDATISAPTNDLR